MREYLKLFWMNTYRLMLIFRSRDVASCFIIFLPQTAFCKAENAKFPLHLSFFLKENYSYDSKSTRPHERNNPSSFSVFTRRIKLGSGSKQFVLRRGWGAVFSSLIVTPNAGICAGTKVNKSFEPKFIKWDPESL